MFSKACEYAIRATISIANRSLAGKRVSLRDISKEINSPEAFTAKILQELARQGIIQSLKGPNGGFEIDRTRMESVRLSQIVFAIDGDSVYRGCGLGLSECSALQPCPLHDKFMLIRNELRDMLENTSIYELALGLKEGITFLKR